jgi:hypothetical protein
LKHKKFYWLYDNGYKRGSFSTVQQKQCTLEELLHNQSILKLSRKKELKEYILPYPPCGNSWQNSRIAFLISLSVRLWRAITLNPMSFRIEATVATSLLGVLRSLRSVYVSLPIRSATFSVAEITINFKLHLSIGYIYSKTCPRQNVNKAET